MRIEVNKNILASNAAAAGKNRERLRRHGVFMVNLMASPGAGKTSAIIKAIERAPELKMAVIEGDIASEIDSLTIEAMGITALQINTGGSCHLTASMITSALNYLDLDVLDLIVIENVGNLVCPAEFDLGETARVMIASIAEGDDKPDKYPLMFRQVDLILLNKMDLLPYCDFDLPRFRQVVTTLNPAAPILELSCKENRGVAGWGEWLTGATASTRAAKAAD
ncbi:MAG: hydrogenase nickel incorporation protein HypB [Actinobacteria bacterium]|nr:hydrogenase nickel incorporation protein HypB [Actinomycetota bacterium]